MSIEDEREKKMEQIFKEWKPDHINPDRWFAMFNDIICAVLVSTLSIKCERKSLSSPVRIS